MNKITFINQTLTRPQEFLDFIMYTSKGTFSFDTRLEVGGGWFIGLTH